MEKSVVYKIVEFFAFFVNLFLLRNKVKFSKTPV